ncbi:MAG TPA: hypothetical protein VEL31_10045, partial [Ktedonobacteraceae bacterium]|nr:hypothetical protein [Ktedonobacteraceae bacterium]
RLETELVRNLGKPVPVIVNLDLIEDIITEFEEVWAARWGAAASMPTVAAPIEVVLSNLRRVTFAILLSSH